MKRTKTQQKKIDKLIHEAQVERKKIEIPNIGVFRESVEEKRSRVKIYSKEEINSIVEEEKDGINLIFKLFFKKYTWLQEGICSNYIISWLFTDKRTYAFSELILDKITLLNEILYRKKYNITPELAYQRTKFTEEIYKLEIKLYKKYIWTEQSEEQILKPIIKYLEIEYDKVIMIFENTRKQLDKIKNIVFEKIRELEKIKKTEGDWIDKCSIQAIENRKIFINEMLKIFSKEVKGGKKMELFDLNSRSLNNHDERLEQNQNVNKVKNEGTDTIQQREQQTNLKEQNIIKETNSTESKQEVTLTEDSNLGQVGNNVVENEIVKIVPKQNLNEDNLITGVEHRISQLEVNKTQGEDTNDKVSLPIGNNEEIKDNLGQNKTDETTTSKINLQEAEIEVEQTNNEVESCSNNIDENNEKKQMIEKYNQILREHHKYKIEDGKLREGLKDISDCLIIVVGKIQKETTLTHYKLKCISLREPEREFEEHIVSARDFDKFNVLSGTEWEEYCYIEFGSSNRQKMKEIALLLGRGNIELERKFNHTGFVNVNGIEYYLYHGGSITVDGTEKIEANLSEHGLENYSFTNQELNVVESIITSQKFLDLTEYGITIPLYSTLVLSPWVSKFREIGINIDYVIFIVGPTNSRKSCTSAVLLSHFGSRFDKNNLPASFKGTTNQLEVRSYILKDNLIIINDFGKEVQGKNKIKLLSDLFEIFGDRQSRERMNSNGSLQKTYKSRGLAIINGEIIPSELSESRLARSVILNLNRDSVNNDKLTYLQHNQDKLAFGMKEYIKWGMINETKILEKAKKMFEEYRTRQNNDVLGRINDSVNIMEIGFSIITDFWKDYGIINDEQHKQWNTLACSELEKLITNQKEEVENANPLNMFYSGLHELFRTNRIYVIDYKDGKKVVGYSGGRKVGYIDTENKLYYFYDKTIYDEILSFYGGANGDFGISRLDLWRQLQNAGLLFTNDNHTKKVIRVDPETKEKVSVVAVKFRDVEEYI